MPPNVEPEFVTFTGADDATRTARMVEIGRRAPVEWGLLFSRKRQNHGRYPGLDFLGSLRGLDLRLAAHVCGAYADEIVDTGACADFEGIAGALGLRFERIQINTGRSFDPARLAAFASRFGARAIAQCRDVFPEDARVDWLHDISAGEGVMPSFRPVPGSDVFGGYAGGLGPGNVASELAAIARAHPAGRPFWIDMETKVRIDDVFDLDCCEAVLAAVYPDGRWRSGSSEPGSARA